MTLRAGVGPAFSRSSALSLSSVFPLPLSCTARIVGGPLGRRVGIWGAAHPGSGAPPRAEDREGGSLGLGSPSGAGLPACLPLAATVARSSSGGVAAALRGQDRAPRARQPRRGSGGSGLCPLSPGCPVKLPELRRHFASASPARRGGGQPVSARRCWVPRRRWPRLVFIPALTETLSATTPAAGSATVALPRARTRGVDRRGSPAAPATPAQRRRLPQAPGAERVWGAGRGGGRHLRRFPVTLPRCGAEH